ncbi:zinc finger protein 131 isoform X2 [Cimex lectularius]|uniref:BTB domain-containing protein n=1 Tax=Cimex lectularius TaxID=79782 RepID=A0A8I6S8R6_CIMLE|nr:zinc finger protein 131 isoform X2 [Cimex lectularius]
MASSKETQQFCVRWNSYQSNLQSAFPKLLTNEHFVDVTLACESRMVKCHKVVLSACSAYFEKLLVQNPCQHPIIFMKDMKYWEVQALVDFMYKGEVNVTQDELASLLKAAEALEVRGLCGQHEQGGNKLSLPRGIEAAAEGMIKKRRMESEVKDLNSVSGNNDEYSNGNHQQSPVNKPANTLEPPKTEASQTPTSSGSTCVKQEMSVNDSNLFEDLDDDFYQDDNSLQIDETGSAYSLAGPSVQLDSSPEGNHWNLNNGYPNVILTESGSSNYGTPSPNNETPGKIQRIRRSDAELLSAADSICKGMTFQKASQTFNIPMSTIRFYMARKGMLPSRRRGRRISQGMEQNMQSHQSTPPQMQPQPQQQPQQQPPPQQIAPPSLSYQQIPNLQMQNPYFKPEPSGY